MTGCLIVPPPLLRRLARDDDPRVSRVAERTLALSRQLVGRREVLADRPPRRAPGVLGDLLPGTRTDVVPPTPARAAAVHRSIHDARRGEQLPGVLVRAEGAPATGDAAADQAYAGLGDTWSLLWEAFGRDSLDGRGLPLSASVHFGTGFDNAYWDGRQMVFGDGDGVYFNGFTGSVDVIGHELAHGFTQFTAALVYVGQSGALNESVSDCFGAMVKQRALGQTADAADWLIGQGLFTSRVNGVALRSMLHPGTAYDDTKLGKDPQPDSMAGYVDEPHDDAHDNGGVHTNSGIPNRAFALAAVACGGHSWQSVGPVWYEALTRGGLPKDADFATFARATVEAATRLDAGSGPAPAGGAAMTEAPARAEAVRAAWRQVGVLGD